jgi:hypothetical protein
VGGGVMAETIALTRLQARRAMQLARWMAKHTRDDATKRKCRHLADSIAVMLSEDWEQAHARRLEVRRKNWRNGTQAYRERKQNYVITTNATGETS